MKVPAMKATRCQKSVGREQEQSGEGKEKEKRPTSERRDYGGTAQRKLGRCSQDGDSELARLETGVGNASTVHPAR